MLYGLADSCYNQFHNILSLFDVFANFPVATSEELRDHYLYTLYM